ncbi:MAG TPA: zf-HC2 domain-containing protein [Candidatus Anammoximicrobium sp.]|nr:zf-HC2 domain-containing protein [Candidatus Anammoximicrobium sp.]
MSAVDHPGRDELFAFLVGTLPEEAEARVYGHISSCDACQAC